MNSSALGSIGSALASRVPDTVRQMGQGPADVYSRMGEDTLKRLRGPGGDQGSIGVWPGSFASSPFETQLPPQPQPQPQPQPSQPSYAPTNTRPMPNQGQGNEGLRLLLDQLSFNQQVRPAPRRDPVGEYLQRLLMDMGAR